jgi:hypothetical protein
MRDGPHGLPGCFDRSRVVWMRDSWSEQNIAPLFYIESGEDVFQNDFNVQRICLGTIVKEQTPHEGAQSSIHDCDKYYNFIIKSFRGFWQLTFP